MVFHFSQNQRNILFHCRNWIICPTCRFLIFHSNPINCTHPFWYLRFNPSPTPLMHPYLLILRFQPPPPKCSHTFWYLGFNLNPHPKCTYTFYATWIKLYITASQRWLICVSTHIVLSGSRTGAGTSLAAGTATATGGGAASAGLPNRGLWVPSLQLLTHKLLHLLTLSLVTVTIRLEQRFSVIKHFCYIIMMELKWNDKYRQYSNVVFGMIQPLSDPSDWENSNFTKLSAKLFKWNLNV